MLFLSVPARNRTSEPKGHKVDYVCAGDKSPAYAETEFAAASNCRGAGVPHISQLLKLPMVAISTPVLISPLASAQLSFDTNSVAPERFVAVHGRKAVIMGYAASGLEAGPTRCNSSADTSWVSVPPETQPKSMGPPCFGESPMNLKRLPAPIIGPDFIVREKTLCPAQRAGCSPHLFCGMPSQHRHRCPLHARTRPDVARLGGWAEYPLGPGRIRLHPRGTYAHLLCHDRLSGCGIA